MKKKIAIFISIGSICFISSHLHAVTQDEILMHFNSANKLYEQNQYEEAAAEYKQIIDMGYQSGALYYNLGNCYFKLGSLGKTILYYEKAKRLIPQDPELTFNLNYVQSLLEDKITNPKISWIVKNLINIATFLSLSTWCELLIILWIISMGCFIISIFTIKFGKYLKYTGFIAFISLIISITFTILHYTTYASSNAIILSKEVVVRYGPGEAEVEAFLLHEGTEVSIKKEQESWYQIQLPDGKSGWLPKDTVEKI